MKWGEFLSILSRNNVNHNLIDIPKLVLWGVAPTGDIHIGYLPYIGILNQLKKFGTKIICLNANYHSYLDSQKTDWEKINERTKHYNSFFEGFDLDKNIIESKQEYIKKSYIENFFRFSNNIPAEKLKVWAGRTLRSSIEDNYKLSDYLYVGMQIYDVIYFDVDLILCGDDESRIYKYSFPFLEELSNKNYHYIYVPMIPGIYKDEMHASDDVANKIIVFDKTDDMEEKIKIYLHHCLKINKKPILVHMINYFILPLFNINPDKSIVSILQRYQESDINVISEKVALDLDKIFCSVRHKYAGNIND